MNTKILMAVTAIYLGIVGFAMTFLPEEIATLFSEATNQTFILSLQILGSIYLGFAAMNWLAKHSLIGGIYNRPLVSGNLLHFLVSAFALIKAVDQYSQNQFIVVLTITVIYIGFALSFAYLLTANPIKTQNKNILKDLKR